MPYCKIHHALKKIEGGFLFLVNKSKALFQSFADDSFTRFFYCVPSVAITGNLVISLLFVCSLKTVLHFRFLLRSSLKSKFIVAHKILDVLEKWESICIQETIFCCEQGTPMLEGDEEFLIHLVGMKEMKGLQEFWNYPWNTKLGEKIAFFNGSLSQTFAHSFHLREYIELSMYAHRLLLSPYKKGGFYLLIWKKSSRENPYHPLLSRLDFIIQYSLFRRMILIQEYRLYESLLGGDASGSSSSSLSSAFAHPLCCDTGATIHRENRNGRKRTNESSDEDQVPNDEGDSRVGPLPSPALLHFSSPTNQTLEKRWHRRRKRRSEKEKNTRKGKQWDDGHRSITGGSRKHDVEDAWRICGTPSWLLSVTDKREQREDSGAAMHFFCLPPSYFPVESVMTHFSDWLYEEQLARMIPVWKRGAVAHLIQCSQWCSHRREWCSQMEDKDAGGQWERKESGEEYFLYRGQAVAAYTAVHFWFYRYTSALLAKQKEIAEETATRFYQDRVYSRSFGFCPTSILSTMVSPWRGMRSRTAAVGTERETEVKGRRGVNRFFSCGSGLRAFFSSLWHGSSSPTSSTPSSRNLRSARLGMLLLLEGGITCAITLLDFFSIRLVSEATILTAAAAVAGRVAGATVNGAGGGIPQRGEEEGPASPPVPVGSGVRDRGRGRSHEEGEGGKGRPANIHALSDVSKEVLWSVLNSVLGALLRGVRREITSALSDALTADLEDHVAAALIAADHAFLDRLFCTEADSMSGRSEGGDGPHRGQGWSFFSPHHSGRGHGLYVPSAKGFMRRVVGVGRMLVSQFDLSIRWWTTHVAILIFGGWWQQDWCSIILAWGLTWCREKDIVGKITVWSGFGQDSPTWLWIREQSPPFHRTRFGLALLVDLLSEMTESSSSWVTSSTSRMGWTSLLVLATPRHAGGMTAAEANGNEEGGEEVTQDLDKSLLWMREDQNVTLLPFPVLTFLACSDVWCFPDYFLTPVSSSSFIRAEGPQYEIQWQRGQRVLQLYRLLASHSTLRVLYQQDPSLLQWKKWMESMQGMTSCIAELVVQPVFGRMEGMGKRIDKTCETTGRMGTEEKKKGDPIDAGGPTSSVSALRGVQEHVYDLDPEEQAIVQHPGALECLPDTSGGGLYAHFNRNSFLLLKQLGLESIMTFKALETKARERAEEDQKQGRGVRVEEGGDSGRRGGRERRNHFYFLSPAGPSSFLSAWRWKWWKAWFENRVLALLDHDGNRNPFVVLLRQCEEVGEVILLAGCTCIRARYRGLVSLCSSSSSTAIPIRSSFFSQEEMEEEETKRRGVEGWWWNRRRSGWNLMALRGIRFPLLEWYTVYTPDTATLLMVRHQRIERYQRALRASSRRSHWNTLRAFSGLHEILSHLPCTMTDTSLRARSSEMIRRRQLWREYLSSSPRFSSLQFNDQHFITGGMQVTEGIRFHHVYFVYPQLHHAVASLEKEEPSGSHPEEEEEPKEEEEKEIVSVSSIPVSCLEGTRTVSVDDSLTIPSTCTPTSAALSTLTHPKEIAGTPVTTTTTGEGRTEKREEVKQKKVACGKERWNSFSSREVLPILSNVSFCFPSTGMTAAIGPTGAGKSTLCHLLRRVYEPIPVVWIRTEKQYPPTEHSRVSSPSCCSSVEEEQSETKRTPTDHLHHERRPFTRRGRTCDEDKKERGNRRRPIRLPWSRELLADIVKQTCQHAIPLPPSLFPAASPPFWEEGEVEERMAATVAQPGYLSWDHIPASCFSLSYLRQWLVQMEASTTILPHCTFEENIRFLYSDVRASDIAWAAAASRCMDFIQETPLQLRQPIRFALSGGEQQRLGLARVLAVSAARQRRFRLSQTYAAARGNGRRWKRSAGPSSLQPTRPFISPPFSTPTSEARTGVGREDDPTVTCVSASWPHAPPSPPSPPLSPTGGVAVVGLLLDEPTSRLDAQNERRVETAMRTLWKTAAGSERGSDRREGGGDRREGSPAVSSFPSLLTGVAPTCMVMVIAHRLSTIQAASHMIVIQNGRVEAEGPPGHVFTVSTFAKKQLALQRIPPSVSHSA